jgi:hypothetical protein
VSGPKEDDMSGISAHGLLVNISPTTARSTFKVNKRVVSGDISEENLLTAHPVHLSGATNELPSPSEDDASSTTLRKGLSVLLSRPELRVIFSESGRKCSYF